MSVLENNTIASQAQWAEAAAQLLQLGEPQAGKRGIPRTIVVGLDHSAAGWQALECAAQLARRFQAQLVLAHAFAPAPPGDRDPTQTIYDRVAPGAWLLARAAQAVADLHPRRVLFAGPAAESLIRIAQLEHADVIVLGRHDHSNHAIRTRQASCFVVQHAPCAVCRVVAAMVRFPEEAGEQCPEAGTMRVLR